MLLPPINPKAVNRSDKFLVLKKEDEYSWRVIESQPTEERAKKACDILRDHSVRCLKPQIYDIREMLAYTP